MLNLPNTITLSRILLVIIFTIALTADGVVATAGRTPMDHVEYTGYFNDLEL